jgi:hypothetical protein
LPDTYCAKLVAYRRNGSAKGYATAEPLRNTKRTLCNQAAREKFLNDPRGEAIRAGLQSHEVEDLLNIDRDGLELFAHSLEHKKAQKTHGNKKNQHP